MKTWCRLAAPLFLASQLSTTVLAQSNPGWIIEVVGGTVSPSNPSVTVKLRAFFFSVFPSTAFGGGDSDIGSSDPMGKFSDMQYGADLFGFCPLGQVGVPSATGGVTGINIGQIQVLGCLANPANPIEIWRATWTTSDFTPRTVELNTTGTTHFELYSHHGASFPDIFFDPKDVIPGSAVIQVIPAPGVLALLLTGAALTTRRRGASSTTIRARGC